mgnify:CR=1 FL=1
MAQLFKIDENLQFVDVTIVEKNKNRWIQVIVFLVGLFISYFTMHSVIDKIVQDAKIKEQNRLINELESKDQKIKELDSIVEKQKISKLEKHQLEKTLGFNIPSKFFNEYHDFVKAESKKHNLPEFPKLFYELVYRESRFNPNAKSYMGAIGYMQLMPANVKRFAHENGKYIGNVKGGVKQLIHHKKIFKTWQATLNVYNSGRTNVGYGYAICAKLSLT